MKKIIYILVGLFFIIFITVLIIFLASKDRISNQERIDESNKTIMNDDSRISSYPQTIQNETGNINLENIYKNRLDLLSEDAFSFRRNENYSMVYFPKEQFFNIVINIEDFDKGRKLAGEDFLNLIGGNKEQACSLNVSISTPYSVNPGYAGVKFDFSFCE